MRGRAGLFVIAGVAIVASAFAACSSSESLAPVAIPTATTPTTPPSSDAGPPMDASPPPDDAGPKKRTVEHRDPFGDVAKAGNLLWDGDFEWESPFSDEYAWLVGVPFTFTLPDMAYGASCRSGVKCASLASGKAIAGVAVAMKSAPLDASVWANVGTQDCGVVTATILDLLDGSNEHTKLTPSTKNPDARGWCHYAGTTPVLQAKPYFTVSFHGKGRALIDDAVLEPSGNAAPPKPAPFALSEDDERVRRALREFLATHPGPHDAPPNAARRALEAFAR